MDADGNPLSRVFKSYTTFTSVQTDQGRSVDEIQEVKNNIEFVIQEMTDIAELQIDNLKAFNQYLGLTLDDILFDLKRSIYLTQIK